MSLHLLALGLCVSRVIEVRSQRLRAFRTAKRAKESMMTYLIAAYFVFWALTFLLVYGVYRKQKALQREIETLREELEHRKG
jgi:cytosine/uracil/thiamine/allantoin permease